ncbi:MAG: NAD(+) diphosphatase, partial [Gemmatimonadetes bacterium]|nr:NAD(+) diphosphatase [Gemmatimonadota bacterium]
ADASGHARACPACDLLFFPRIAPAVIVLVRRGDEALLARSPHFAPGVYSPIAGFVEPGESLEDAVRRETLEETGVALADVRYFGSQPWPFPHTLMVGFTAEYADGELRRQRDEIEDAAWFTRDRPPVLPSPISIARALVDAWLAEPGGRAARSASAAR